MEDGGSIKVSLVDDQGEDIVTAETVSKTLTDGLLDWSHKMSSEKIRIKFEINNAKLYSFSFAE